MAIESANVVGYQNTSAQGGFNYYTPGFRNVSGEDINLQDIAMGDEVGAMEANLQIRGADGVSTAYYVWFDKATAEAFGLTDGTKGCWATEEGGEISPSVTLKPGDGVQIDTINGYTIANSGEVSDADIVYETRQGFNFIGNAFPAEIDIQDIVMHDNVGAMEANLQIRGADGVSSVYYVWFDKATAEAFGLTDGTKGCWATEEGAAIEPTVKLNASAVVQVDTASGNVVTVLAPIEL